jgi:hypothetical protein
MPSRNVRKAAPKPAKSGPVPAVKMGTKSKPDLSQIASPGLDFSGGLVYDSTIRELQGPRQFRIYREMADHSAVIGGCLLAFEMLIRKVKWTVEPGDASSEEQERAEIIQSFLDDMSVSWPDTVTEILSMLVYGWSYMEVVYKIRKGPDEKDSRYHSRFSDGVVGWRKWALVPQETLHSWEWDKEGGLQALIQSGPPDYKQRRIPIDKALLFRTKAARNNPQGRSLLLNAYYPWQMAKRTMEYEAIGVERDLAGLPMALIPPDYLDPNATAEEKAMLEAIKKLVTGVRQNEHAGIVFPMAWDDENNPMFEFRLIASAGMKQADTNKIIERYERRMAMSMLADVILMGHERVGSLALSRDKTTLIGRAIAGILQSIAAVINRHAIPQIYRLNGWKMEHPARFVPGDIENADIKNLGNYVQKLVSVGAITPDPDLEASLRESGGLPLIDPEWQLGRDERLLPGQMPPPEEDDDEDDDEGTPPAKKPEKKPSKKPAAKSSSTLADLMEAAEARRQARRGRKKAA